MPLYEYVCQSCGQEFEKIVRLSEADRAPECPTCHGQETRKRVSKFASVGGSSSGGSVSASSCGSSGRFS